jgi:hypothetical protein
MIKSLVPLTTVLAVMLCAMPVTAQRGSSLPTGEAWLAARATTTEWPEAGLYDLKLPSIDRQKTLQLSDFRGKKVLLIQFASW